MTAPVSDEGGGVGVDLRTTGDTYLTIKDLRVDAREIERQAAKPPNTDDDQELEAVPELASATHKWAELAELAIRELAFNTKDLEIACWLCEALVRTQGFGGMAYGLELSARLLENYWDAGLFPLEEEGGEGLEDRIAPVVGLLGREGVGLLVKPVGMLPLSDRSDLPTATLSALVEANLPVPPSDDAGARERRVAAQTQKRETLGQAIRSSSPAFLRETYEGVRAASQNLKHLMDAVQATVGIEAFGSKVSGPLEAIAKELEDRVGHVLRDDVADAPGAEADAPADGAPAATASAGFAAGAPSSRAQAFDTLNQIADFFERTEPQSIVARSLRDVVRRARMPLEELLAELLPDAGARGDFLLRAGIKDNGGEDGGGGGDVGYRSVTGSDGYR